MKRDSRPRPRGLENRFRKHRFRNQRGFTLVELLIALLALTVGLLAAGVLQLFSIRGNFMSGNASAALTLAAERMEDLMTRSPNDPLLADVRPFNNQNLSSLADFDFEERLNEKGQPASEGFYRRIWNVADNSPEPPLKTITVIVTWEGNGHPVTLTCIR